MKKKEIRAPTADEIDRLHRVLKYSGVELTTGQLVARSGIDEEIVEQILETYLDVKREKSFWHLVSDDLQQLPEGE